MCSLEGVRGEVSNSDMTTSKQIIVIEVAPSVVEATFSRTLTFGDVGDHAVLFCTEYCTLDAPSKTGSAEGSRPRGWKTKLFKGCIFLHTRTLDMVG